MCVSKDTVGILAFQMFSFNVSRSAEEDLFVSVKAHCRSVEGPGLLFFELRFVLRGISTDRPISVENW